ncbi:hypothetical protein O5558_20370 [Escherichia coli]|nr:hypothetical protein [Escherichia coli]
MSRLSKPESEDVEPRFVHLRVHWRPLDDRWLGQNRTVGKKAAALGMPALAITDFTNLCGAGEVLRSGTWRRD